MIIKRVEIENYRNFDMASAEFSKFNVLIGKNGTGKSNFLNAIMLPLRGTTLNGKPFDPYKDKRNIKADTTIKVWSELSEEESTNIMPVNSANIATGLLYQLLSRDNTKDIWIKINQIGTPITSSYTSVISATPERKITVESSFRGEERDLLYGTFIYPVADSREMPEVFQSGMPRIATNLDFGNALLEMKLNFRDEYDNLIEEIKQISPEISDILVHSHMTNAWEIQFKEANINPILNVQNISKGTREIAMMLVILELSHEKSTILIEEPEVHLYPLAIKKLKDIMLNHIKRKNLQLIISTHSEVFLMSDLDPVQNKDVKFFEFNKRNGVSSIIELKEDKEISEARDRLSIQ